MESGVLGGIAAFAYVAALWYAAPLAVRDARPIADRLRGAIVIGVAVPGVLALVHALYAPLVWLCAAALAALGAWKRPQRIHIDAGLLATLAGAIVICWPPLVRPLLEGDTLLYHLPIAVSFVQTHSLWTAQAPYWMYPPASELFAAGLLDASGRWSLPLAGMLPALLLTARLYTISRAANAPAYAAAGVALAFLCMPVAAFQAGTLQNDLWLAVFFVEIASAADASSASVAICALLKPMGWIEALIAAGASRVPLRAVAIGFVPLAIWGLHVVVLLHSGAAIGFVTPPYLAGTFAGNLAAAVPQLVHGIAAVTPQSFVWFAAILAGFAFSATRRYAIAALLVLAVYAFTPVAYTNGVTNYANDASSLRFALPALACGALILATLSARAPGPIAIAAYALALWGAWSVVSIFWTDSYTRWGIAAAAIAMLTVAAASKTRSLSIAAAALAIVIAGAWSASSRALGFYGDWMRDNAGKSTGVFAWLDEHHPASIVAQNVRTGAIFMVSPRTRAVDSLLGDACVQAKRLHALLLVGSNEDANVAHAFGDARACGSVVYEDGAALIVRPPSGG